MTNRAESSPHRPMRPATATAGFAASFSLVIGCLVPLGPVRAQEPWRGLTIPRYADAADYSVSADDDEYEIRFRSPDSAQAVFEFYRDYLARQGFRIVGTEAKKDGFEADMVRGQAGPGDTIELDARLRNGRHKVEIEFDD